MKKIYWILIITLFFSINLLSKTFALSNEFLFLLETMGVETINPDGLKINEDIYQQYKLLVYGSPHDFYRGQRWKNVVDGKWSKNVGPWNGTGIRGEYWILGVNYYGKEVHNHLFPVDIEPPTAPTEWKYAIISDALESWQDAEKYMDDIQKEYMLNQNLTRNNITYDLKVTDIGLDKARLENYATWKTKGSVYTQRYDRNNKKWAANFLIPSMAADAELESYMVFQNGMEYTISEDMEYLTIPITYGSRAIHLTDYAKKEHVKNIKSQLYINGVLIDEKEDSEILQIEKNINYEINKNDHPQQDVLVLNVENRSTLLTKFTTDGILVDITNYTIIIYLNDKGELQTKDIYISSEDYATYPEIAPPEITEVEIKRIVDGEEKDLWIAQNTKKQFICAGQTISFKVKAINFPDNITLQFAGDSSISKLDSLTKLFEWTEPRERKEKTIVSSLNELKEMYSGRVFMECVSRTKQELIFECIYIIPYETKQTLHSWSSLREISKDAFSIKENDLFSRIRKPYEIVIKARSSTGVDTKRIELDVFERWDTLYNRDLTKYVTN